MKTFTLLLLVFGTVSLCISQEKSEFNKIQLEGVVNPVIPKLAVYVVNIRK